jgi:hypothetical protein
VVETGVARGISSRIILTAMQRNDCGRLASIDLYSGPDARIAVPKALRDRWTYLAGSSRTHLPNVLLRSEPAMFIHDSQHTLRNMRFELKTAWAALKNGGVLIADDIHENVAFAELQRATCSPVVIGQEQVKARLFGITTKRAP